jgi:uncharacterized membrane protein
MPERTIHIGGIPLPLCARDTGIYLGGAIALIYCIVRGKLKSDKVPSIPISVILALSTVPMMIDAVSSYISIRQTDNTARLMTGIFFGMPIVLFLIPAANYKVYDTNKLKVIDSLFDLLLLSLINICVGIIIIKLSIPIWWIVSTASLLGLVFIITRLGYTIIKLLNIGNPKWRVIYALVLTTIIFGMLFMLKYYVLEWLRLL